ncbi:protein UL83B [Cercopithecine betaherpesvirus 5]|uniref:Protein UL83B n=1 Tax=Simian cytomegalovirus (strain Colburn) TaxID=50292 RepID=G8XTE6_SCMVC|nr:protein UL83B [Cercopithecine betaherpesvirus 5]AEV80438.1 protein UL83B [Cercopithecine betaherpesvirus 5]
MATSSPERHDDEFITVISGTVIKAIFSESPKLIPTNTTGILKSGIKVKVNQPSAVFVTQCTQESQPCKRYDIDLQVKHTTFEVRDIDNVAVDVYNPTDQGILTSAGPLSFYIYAIPLDIVAIPQLFLHPGENRKHRIPVADTVVQEVEGGWHTRLTVSRLVWSRNQSRYRPNSMFHTTSFIFNAQNMPLDVTNTADELVCSLPDTHVTNVQKISKREVKVYMECTREDPPENKAFVHLSWKNGRSDVVMSRNPKPFLTPHDRNGFIISCPQNLHLKPGKTSHLMFDIHYESTKYVAIICPKAIPGVSISCNPLLPTQTLFLEVRATQDSIHLDKWETLGWLYFIKRNLLLTKGPTGVEHFNFIDQYRLMAKLEYENIYSEQADEDCSDSSCSDSDMECSYATMKRPPPPPSRSGRQSSTKGKRFPKTERDDDHSDDENQDNMTLCWPNWQCAIKVKNLTPIVVSADSDNVPADQFFWGQKDFFRIFYATESEWQPCPTQRRRRHTRSEPGSAPYTASVKKHRS